MPSGYERYGDWSSGTVRAFPGHPRSFTFGFFDCGSFKVSAVGTYGVLHPEQGQIHHNLESLSIHTYIRLMSYQFRYQKHLYKPGLSVASTFLYVVDETHRLIIAL